MFTNAPVAKVSILQATKGEPMLAKDSRVLKGRALRREGVVSNSACAVRARGRLPPLSFLHPLDLFLVHRLESCSVCVERGDVPGDGFDFGRG